MPKIDKDVDTCTKCSHHFRWDHSIRGWCWWCEGKPKSYQHPIKNKEQPSVPRYSSVQ